MYTIADKLDDQDNGLYEREDEAGPGYGTTEPASSTISGWPSAATERIPRWEFAVLKFWVRG